jgi:hypothetical protein
MKPKQLKILATALLIVCLGAVVSVTAQNPTTVGGYFSANIGFRVNTTCSIISAAFLTAPDRPIASWRAIAFSIACGWERAIAPRFAPTDAMTNRLSSHYLVEELAWFQTDFL